jgi:hypothetical protein
MLKIYKANHLKSTILLCHFELTKFIRNFAPHFKNHHGKKTR